MAYFIKRGLFVKIQLTRIHFEFVCLLVFVIIEKIHKHGLGNKTSVGWVCKTYHESVKIIADSSVT